MTPHSTDRETLLNEILSDERLENLRSASLDHALTLIRRRRRQRRIARGAGAAALAIAVLLTVLVLAGPEPASLSDPAAPPTATTPPAAESPAAPSAPRPGRQPEYISDEQLLALFPNRPVALVGAPGQQKLIFLDEPSPRNRF